MKKTLTKKLAFSSTTVRQLQQTIDDEQLARVAGGTYGGEKEPAKITTTDPNKLVPRITPTCAKSVSGASYDCPAAC